MCSPRVLVGIELTEIYLFLLSAWIKGVHHHTQVRLYYVATAKYLRPGEFKRIEVIFSKYSRTWSVQEDDAGT